MNSVITFNEVTRTFGKVVALHDLSFRIERNSCVALVGNNGCGKTTTVNILANLIKYHGGEYLFDGTRVTPQYHSFKKRVGFVFCKPIYIDVFDVTSYLKFVAKYQGVLWSDAHERIDDLLTALALHEHKHKAIKELSAGNQMKVSVASALIHNPEVLILDEPFINLDNNTINSLMSILQSVKSSKTLFVTSHNLELVSELCDRFLVMENGHISLDLAKKDFDGVQALKEHLKASLVAERPSANLSWLRG